jgi:hypothetical protein
MRNIIAGFKADIDSFVTIDGDNTVLLQQISRHCLNVLKKQMATPSGIDRYHYISNYYRKGIVFCKAIWSIFTGQEYA